MGRKVKPAIIMKWTVKFAVVKDALVKLKMATTYAISTKDAVTMDAPI